MSGRFPRPSGPRSVTQTPGAPQESQQAEETDFFHSLFGSTNPFQIQSTQGIGSGIQQPGLNAAAPEFVPRLSQPSAALGSEAGSGYQEMQPISAHGYTQPGLNPAAPEFSYQEMQWLITRFTH